MNPYPIYCNKDFERINKNKRITKLKTGIFEYYKNVKYEYLSDGSRLNMSTREIIPYKVWINYITNNDYKNDNKDYWVYI